MAIAGKQPNQLFGKFTWRLENFSEISNHGTKRELRSNQFSVGEYKWYILVRRSHPHAATGLMAPWLLANTCCMPQVYPQGCDVCNHLSLFLCVADYDKLLPGTLFLLSDHAAARGSLKNAANAWHGAAHDWHSSGSGAGWSHFAQFTIAVVNKDPKKSKYSGQQQRPLSAMCAEVFGCLPPPCYKPARQHLCKRAVPVQA